MRKITQSEWDEFMSTDSIKRKAELRELLHDAIELVLKEKQGDKISWWFPDAEEGEVGNLEDFIGWKSNRDKRLRIDITIMDEHGQCRSDEDSTFVYVEDIISS